MGKRNRKLTKFKKIKGPNDHLLRDKRKLKMSKEIEAPESEVKTLKTNDPSRPQFRHRRIKNHTGLSRGQKRRVERKMRLNKKKALVNKVKESVHIEKSRIENQEPNKKTFAMNDIDDTLESLMKSIENNVNSNNDNSGRNISKSQKKKNLLAEKEKIMKTLENKNFDKNPFETLKNKIRTDIYVKEKNNEVDSNLKNKIKNIKK